MRPFVSTAKKIVQRYTGPLFLVGIGAILFRHWRLWQQDQERLAERQPAVMRPKTGSSGEAPRVSFLVAAWQEAHPIQDFIQSFLNLRYPDKELILCAGGEDGTYDIARSTAGEAVTLMPQLPGEGKQRALEKCLAASTGMIVYLTDADCELEDSAVESIINALLAGEKAATGTNRPLDRQLEEAFVVYQWFYQAYAARKKPPYVYGLEGCNTALWRSALEAAGGFQQAVATGTDYYLSMKLKDHGIPIRYVANSVIRTEYPSRYRDYWRQRSRWQRNILLHGVQFGEWVAVWRHLQRGGLGIFILGLPLYALLRSRLLVGLWVLLMLENLCAKARYMGWGDQAHQTRYHLWKNLPELCVYSIVDFISWVIPWLDIIVPSQRRKW